MGAASSRTWRWLEITSCVCCFAIAASSRVALQQLDQSPQQSERQPPIFRAEHNEVEVVVVVRDSKGHVVGGLKPGDFEVRDNGRRQSITTFSVQEATPVEGGEPKGIQSFPSAASTAAVPRRFLALFFDDVHTEPGDFARVQKAAEQFVQESLPAEDRVAIFKASENGEVTFTNDKPKLVATIDALRVHAAGNASTVAQCPRLTNYEAYLIVNQLDPEALTMVAQRLRNCICPPPASQGCPPLENLKVMSEGYAEATWQVQNGSSRQLLAALDLSVHVLGNMPGRRMLLLTSSGFLSGNLDSDVNRLIDNALRRGVVLSALSAKGLYASPPGGNLSEQRLEGTAGVSPKAAKYESFEQATRAEAENEAMTDFAQSTGGKFFNSNNDFLQAFRDLAAPEVSYSLAFSPHPLKHDGKFHNLRVEVKASGHVNVYARKGYFAPSDQKNKIAEAAVPLPQASGGMPAQPASATDDFAKSTLPRPQPETVAESSSSSSIAAKSPSPDALAESSSDLAFLSRASRQVDHYIEAFADLTADETRVMQSFDQDGFPDKRRSMQSALVIYRLRNDPRSVMEYRDVVSIDRHEIKGHVARATKLWQGVAQAHSAQEEVWRLTADGERYDIGMAASGLTMFEGLPLRSLCAGDFTFREARHAVANGRPVRVFAYQQIRPCGLMIYHFGLPAQFAGIPLLHAGELTLDAEAGQVVREERNVYLGDPGKKGPRVAHITLGYGESQFGILVPKTIEIETFVPRMNKDMAVAGFRPYARTLETYGPFSRFEVSVGETVSEPAH